MRSEYSGLLGRREQAAKTNEKRNYNSSKCFVGGAAGRSKAEGQTSQQASHRLLLNGSVSPLKQDADVTPQTFACQAENLMTLRMFSSIIERRGRSVASGIISTGPESLIPGPDDEVEAVKKIFALASEGGMGVSRIAAELNRNGITNRGKRSQKVTVHKILRSPVYIGLKGS